MHVPEQIKQTTACNVAMADSICIINNSYHETFFMKFSAVLSAVRAYNRGANIEKVRVCFACQCNTPTPAIVKPPWFCCCWQNVGGLRCSAHASTWAMQGIAQNDAPKVFCVRPDSPNPCCRFGIRSPAWLAMQHRHKALHCHKWDMAERVQTVLFIL